MDFTYHVFLRSKTVDSDWSFFVLPTTFKESKGLSDRLLKIINGIYRDDEVKNITQQTNAFYFFPLDSYLVFTCLWRANFNDISGRPIWTFAGIVVDMSQALVCKKVLPELVFDNSVFKKIEENYINYRGAVPFPPETSIEQKLNITVCGQLEETSDKENQDESEKHITANQLSSKITGFPFNDTGKKDLIGVLKTEQEEYNTPPMFFVFGPGFQAFTDENVSISQSRPITARLKSSFFNSKDEDPDKKITWEYCIIYKVQATILGFRISHGPRYIAEKTDPYDRKTRVAEEDDLLQLGLQLERDGWSPDQDSDWRETGRFPGRWKRASSLTGKKGAKI